jgi:hypothetical protein
MLRGQGMTRAAIAIVWLLAPSAAFAACSSEFSVNDLVAAMNGADKALGQFDGDQAREILDQAKSRLACTQDIVHPNQIGRFAMIEAQLAFFDQDEDTATQWATLARHVSYTVFPPSIPEEHPFRGLVADIAAPDPVGPEQAFLRVPANGAIVLDGRLIQDALAPSECQNFLQVVDGTGVVVRSFWQDGSVFPNDVLRADTVSVATPDWWVEPDPKLDPSKPVVIDPAVIEKRKAAAARKAAEAEAAEKARIAAAAAEEKKLAAVRSKAEKEAHKQAVREERERLRELERNPPREEKPLIPTDWADFDLSDVRATLQRSDAVDDGKLEATCDDLVAIEPRAMLGRLSDAEVECLEVKLRREERQTAKDRVSRILMADAWEKKEPGRWEGSVRRHLTDIDRSDADLCFVFARYLAREGPDQALETLKWSEAALQNASQWEGDVFTDRLYALYRLRAIAAQQKWYALEQLYLANDQRKELLDQAAEWRNQTKNYAREWLQYSQSAGADGDLALRLCVSAAGFADYCRND